MTLVTYGAVELYEANATAREEYERRIMTLAIALDVAIEFGQSADKYVEGTEFSGVCTEPNWVTFLFAKPDPRWNRLWPLFDKASTEGGNVLKAQPNLTGRTAWPRSDQFRFLYLLYSDWAVKNGFIVCEDSSGDVTGPDEAARLPVTQILARLWNDYVFDVLDDPCAYQVDLAALPA